jgi:hypothetical protein
MVPAVQVEQRGVEVAAIERAQKIIPAGDQMGDVVFRRFDRAAIRRR